MFQGWKWTVIEELTGYEGKDIQKETVGIKYSPEEGGFLFLEGNETNIPVSPLPNNYCYIENTELNREENIKKAKNV